jgi:hypothetical protein
MDLGPATSAKEANRAAIAAAIAGWGFAVRAVEGPVGPHHARPEMVYQGLVAGPPGRRHLSGYLVGVDHHRPPRRQQRRHRGLP